MADQPNFVFIMTDTQATNAVGAYGHPDLRTPNIDRLAREGLRFSLSSALRKCRDGKGPIHEKGLRVKINNETDDRKR